VSDKKMEAVHTEKGKAFYPLFFGGVKQKHITKDWRGSNKGGKGASSKSKRESCRGRYMFARGRQMVNISKSTRKGRVQPTSG